MQKKCKAKYEAKKNAKKKGMENAKKKRFFNQKKWFFKKIYRCHVLDQKKVQLFRYPLANGMNKIENQAQA